MDFDMVLRLYMAHVLNLDYAWLMSPETLMIFRLYIVTFALDSNNTQTIQA